MVSIPADIVAKDYRVERLDHKRLHDLELLHEAVYGSLPARNYFTAKYDTAYTGAFYIGFIAYNSDNLPIAYYGVMPCFMQYDRSIFLAAQSGDTMTHPGFRYKGLFVELANRTFELCRQTGIQLVYGFPNQNSRHGLINKLGWHMTESLDRFSIPVSSFPAERLTKQFSWTKQLYENHCQKVLQSCLLEMDGLPHSAAKENFGSVLRDERFLAYKKYSPSYVIGIGNAKVWFRLRQELTIGDMECSENDFSTVITELKKITKRLGLPSINFQVSPGTRLHRMFAAAFTPAASFPVCFKDLGSGVPLEKIKFSFADIDIF
jgi:hypothetical protein